MKCPTCLGDTLYNGNPFRPFCSERCKLIDLGKWASERFRISAGPDGSVEPEARSESGDE
jgi:endogenous inhibitor of DNA gyrase (YacG/DUF329 family)